MMGLILAGCLAVLGLSASVVPAAQARERAVFPEPASLVPAVRFWVRVYTRIDTDSGYLHDATDLSVIYTTLHFRPGSSRWARERLVRIERDRYAAALRRMAEDARPRTRLDERVLRLWGPRPTRQQLLEAATNIRFQLGQSNRFREGLVRSGRWKQDIAETLAHLGLPQQLAALPQVESSFNPRAWSKDGAAGLWQFMRSTGRRYLLINSTVDERLDPFSSTEAAAQLLSYDHRLLGTWPLAITAYNFGAAGMRRAVEAVRSENIATIIRDYHGPAFGFASRNFYASFLAVLQIDRDPQRYFGPIHRDPEARFEQVRLPFRVATVTLERVLHVRRRALRTLNPALLPVCWYDGRDVPKGYVLRLPISRIRWTEHLLARRLEAPRATEAVLARAASRRRADERGRTEFTADVEPAAVADPADAALGPTLDPGRAVGSEAADPLDYSVAPNGTIVVAAAESLGYYAEWLHVSAWTLRRLNHMPYGRPVVMGRRIRLTFRRVSPQAFVAKRLAYHRALEQRYFAAHRILGTKIHLVRPGESLWSLTTHYADVPIWLLEQYNPDLDFSDMRAGTHVVVPRVEEDSGR